MCAEAGASATATCSRVDAEDGEIALTAGETLPARPIPPILLEMVRDGGLLPHLEKRLERAREYDLLIKNVRVVRPNAQRRSQDADIAITGGKFAQIAPGIDRRRSEGVYDGKGGSPFPGVVDAHMHTGIYSPLDEDAVSESRAAARAA